MHGEALAGPGTVEAGRSAPGPSDPTRNAALHARRARIHDQVALAALLLSRSREYALPAGEALADGLRPRPDEHVKAPYHDPESIPKTETTRDAQEALEAKARRGAHGEGWGNA